MALVKKSTQLPQTLADARYPDKFPTLPDDVGKRFPSLSQWFGDLNRVLFELRQSIIRDRDALAKAVSDDSTALSTFQTATNQSLATANAALAALAATFGGVGTPASSAAVAALQLLLGAHIAADSAHGTATPILGESDPQLVDSKQIGRSQPGYGRFRQAMTGIVVDASETVIVPAGYGWVVPGSLTVNGILSIEGNLAIV